MVLLSSLIYLQIFCQTGLPIVEIEVLKSPTVIVDLLISPFVSVFALHSFQICHLMPTLLCLLCLFGVLIFVIR